MPLLQCERRKQHKVNAVKVNNDITVLVKAMRLSNALHSLHFNTRAVDAPYLFVCPFVVQSEAHTSFEQHCALCVCQL